MRVPVCVERPHQEGREVVATVHGDDVTIGGQRTAEELLIKMISKKYETGNRYSPREERENSLPCH